MKLSRPGVHSTSTESAFFVHGLLPSFAWAYGAPLAMKNMTERVIDSKELTKYFSTEFPVIHPESAGSDLGVTSQIRT